MATVKGILDATGREAVVLVQADHGLRVRVPQRTAGQLSWEDVQQRFDAFGAYFVPRHFDDLPDSLSAVNILGIVENRLGLESSPLLEDRYFFSALSRPFNFAEIHPRQ